MVEENYPDIEEDAVEEQEEDAYERQQEFYESDTQKAPSEKVKDDLYSLFWKIIDRTDSSKVGNLDKFELGMLNIPVRDCQKIALLGDIFGHKGFADFFRSQAEIILSTSASKKGWLPELFVTTQKRTTKAREMAIQNLPQYQPKKKSLFGRR